MNRTMAVMAATLTLAACGESAADDATTTIPDGGRVAVGDPISVEDALDSDGRVLVSGYLFVLEDGTVILADAILESYPPQPGGATIVVEGFAVEGMALEEPPADSGYARVKWTDEPFEVLGTVQGGVLVYYDNPHA